MKEQILALLYHPSPAVRRQGAELAIAVGEVPLTLDDSGAVASPRGVHGPLLRALLEASAGFRSQVRTLHLALDEESRALAPRLVELPNLQALHLVGEGSVDLAMLEDLPLKRLTVGGAYASAGLPGLERLAGLEALVVRGSFASSLPDLRHMRALRTLRLPQMPDLERMPSGLTRLRFDNRIDEEHLRRLSGFPLEELSLQYLYRSLTPEQFPSLRRLRAGASGEDFERALRWPLEQLRLYGPTDDALRALAEHPTLRDLTLGLPSSSETPVGRIISFDTALLSSLDRLEVFAPDSFAAETPLTLPWPPGARCPILWAQLPERWGETLPAAVRARSIAGWRAAGNRWQVRILAPSLSAKIAAIKVIRARWGFGLRDSKELHEAAADRGLPLLNLHTARTLQAALLSCGEVAAIEPVAEEPP